eukprot:CAMPEP_0202817160 /NCGR_PEP_ID=MMETSP1389-20130828/7450_1 /ASSEMBLY_ACC=CAM_ASM_000865 /TAXON_ID=302021 /ORGANISM="Rhodomonas sp., Strain CCMP768" /LENGTH=67 /DNA_ID=CAMNT_0049489331 /DNA_START=165 /DNA_END=365 /DNA_ORIENTATION=+
MFTGTARTSVSPSPRVNAPMCGLSFAIFNAHSRAVTAGSCAGCAWTRVLTASSGYAIAHPKVPDTAP